MKRIYWDAFLLVAKYVGILFLLTIFGINEAPIWLKTGLCLGLIYCLVVRLLKRYYHTGWIAASIMFQDYIESQEDKPVVDAKYEKIN